MKMELLRTLTDGKVATPQHISNGGTVSTQTLTRDNLLGRFDDVFGTEHTIEVYTKGARCSCKSFRFQRGEVGTKSCKHIDRLTELLESVILSN